MYIYIYTYTYLCIYMYTWREVDVGVRENVAPEIVLFLPGWLFERSSQVHHQEQPGRCCHLISGLELGVQGVEFGVQGLGILSPKLQFGV